MSPVEADLPGGSRPDLLALAAELVDVPSLSHEESMLADAVEGDLSQVDALTVERLGDTVVARTDLGLPSRIVLAGHLDTVPGDTEAGAVVVGEVLQGLGAVDMKGGVAVMLALAVTITDPVMDTTFVFYPCEEVGREYNGLSRLASERPDLLAADAAVLGEPTSGLIEAGCQGTLHADINFGGSRAHTARPFMGVNAIHRVGPTLELLSRFEPRRVTIDGCEYAEQLQAVSISGGVASNVVPDAATVRVNYRFAPDRSAKDAEQYLRSVLAPFLDASMGDELVVTDLVAGALPSLTQPTIAKLVEATGCMPKAKVGWTDAATFAAIGVPATNFGPGDPLLAHTSHERVTRAELERAYSVLEGVLSGR